MNTEEIAGLYEQLDNDEKARILKLVQYFADENRYKYHVGGIAAKQYVI